MTSTVRVLSLILLMITSTPSVQAAALEPRQSESITPLNAAQVDFFTPYTYFASTAYCKPNTTMSWTCGANCQVNGDFKPVASGGDGGSVQYWFVGYSPSLSSVIVAHQGTDFSKISAVATDVDIFLGRLDPTLFPRINSAIEVHNGFADEQAKTATDVLSAVRFALSNYGASRVTIVGHSLGAAIALLDSVYLPLHLPSNISFRTITYGMPRVGNKAFANYVDANLDLTHINNKKDPVPILPAMFLGYHHPSGEVHITEAGSWESCPGQDNPSQLCIVGAVPSVLEGNSTDHDGPYNNITMKC